MIWGYHYFWKHPYTVEVERELDGSTSGIGASHITYITLSGQLEHFKTLPRPASWHSSWAALDHVDAMQCTLPQGPVKMIHFCWRKPHGFHAISRDTFHFNCFKVSLVDTLIPLFSF